MDNKLLCLLSIASLLCAEGMDHTQATSFCAQQNKVLPRYHELLSIVSQLPQGVYWSSSQHDTTPYAISTNKETNLYNNSDKLFAHCIEKNGTSEKHEFTLSPLTVIDHSTHLTWERKTTQSKKERYTFENALSYCENLHIDGGNWYVPSLEELTTIINEEKTSPSTFEPFNETIFKYYWTSTSSPIPFSNEAYVVGFKKGSIALSPKVNESFVRCVKK